MRETVGCEPFATEVWTDKSLRAIRSARGKGWEEKKGYEELTDFSVKAVAQYSRQLERKNLNRDRKGKDFSPRF